MPNNKTKRARWSYTTAESTLGSFELGGLTESGFGGNKPTSTVDVNTIKLFKSPFFIVILDLSVH